VRGITAAAFCLLLIVAGCSDLAEETVEGSGNVITEARDVKDFDAISVQGFGEVRIEIGPFSPLTIEAEDNVLPHIVSEVDGSTLELRTEEGIGFRDVEVPICTITMPALTGISISGSGDVEAAGIAAGSFDISISGSGDVRLTEMDVTSLDVSISGSGDVRVTGKADGVSVSISGSGNFRGRDLVGADGAVSISGGGSVEIQAIETLDVEIRGSGNVVFSGDPVVTESISGSGSVEPG
jgi:hypothetical protein